MTRSPAAPEREGSLLPPRRTARRSRLLWPSVALLSGCAALAGLPGLLGATRSGDGSAVSRTVSPRSVRVTGDVVPFMDYSDSTHSYSPQQLRTAYHLGRVYRAGIEGQGETIGIVDVYGDPSIRNELKRFDQHFHLPAPPSFTVVEPAGKVPPFRSGNGEMDGWAGETSLDVEMAHAIAPKASIVLAVTGVDEVEGTSGFSEIMAAERYLIDTEHVDVISQSFGATEETFPSRQSLVDLRGAFRLAKRHDVTVLAAAGDQGVSGAKRNGTSYYARRVVSWPASDPLVTAVGGLQMNLDAKGRPVSPTQVWGDNGGPDGGGGGVSEYFSRPSWQAGVASVVGAHRGIPDVGMEASCVPGATIYVQIPGSAGQFGGTCGTSLATPLFAGIVALADQLHGGGLGLLGPKLYALGAGKAPGLVDVTRGSNTVWVPTRHGTKEVKGYDAVAGYDLSSGWGTADAAELVPELAGKPL